VTDLPGTTAAEDADATLLDVATLAAIEVELADVATALERLDEGTYGTCETCGADLPDEVLADAPATRRCAEHAT
jgi:RNA polymerase-binding transcription factor DksA